MEKKEFQNQQGFVMISVFIVLIILLALSSALVALTISEIRQVENHNKYQQAYNYARSGAEKAFMRIGEGLANLTEDQITGQSSINSELFGDFSVDQEDWVFQVDEEEDISVEINLINYDDQKMDNEFKITDLKYIEVRSRGQVGKVTARRGANYMLEYADMFPPPMGHYPEGTKTAQDEDVEWVAGSGNSGVIEDTDGDIWGKEDNSYVFRGPGNSLRLTSNKTAKFRGENFYFDDLDDLKAIQMMKGSRLELYSDSVAFYINIELEDNPDPGQLCFHPPEDEVRRVYFAQGVDYGNEQIVEPGIYTYPEEGICLPGDEDKLEEYRDKRIMDIEEWDMEWR
ncbi:MAG: hypothetical protein ACOC1S_01505 [bacterium]